MINRLLAGLVFALVAATARAQCPQFFAQGVQPATAGVELICHTSYAIGFNGAWEDPAWTAEHLTAQQVADAKGFSRDTGGDFHPEDGLPAAERIKKSDYNNSGFDRGHMAPAGDFGADKSESFSMANMVPQTGELNRQIWAGIETAVRDLAQADGELYIVTGPLVPLGHVSIDKGRIAVPTHTWKAVYDPAKGTGAYICGNTTTPHCAQESVSQLAQQIGFDPFPRLPANLKTSSFGLPQPAKGGHLAN